MYDATINDGDVYGQFHQHFMNTFAPKFFCQKEFKPKI